MPLTAGWHPLSHVKLPPLELVAEADVLEALRRRGILLAGVPPEKGLDETECITSLCACLELSLDKKRCVAVWQGQGHTKTQTIEWEGQACV